MTLSFIDTLIVSGLFVGCVGFVFGLLFQRVKIAELEADRARLRLENAALSLALDKKISRIPTEAQRQ